MKERCQRRDRGVNKLGLGSLFNDLEYSPIEINTRGDFIAVALSNSIALTRPCVVVLGTIIDECIIEGIMIERCQRRDRGVNKLGLGSIFNDLEYSPIEINTTPLTGSLPSV